MCALAGELLAYHPGRTIIRSIIHHYDVERVGGALGGERPQSSEGERAGSSRAMPAAEGGLAHEDVQKLQAAVHDLTECRRLLDAALAQKI